MFKHKILMLGLVFLAGCSSPVTTETKFGATSDKAIIVFGFGCIYTTGTCSANMRKLNKDGSVDRVERFLTATNGETIFSQAQDTNDGKIVYSSYVAEPGDYAFFNFETFLYPTRRQTTLFKDDKFLMKFKIEAGTVNYIGDLLIFAKTFPARIVSHKYNRDGARLYLDRYPNISGEMLETKIERASLIDLQKENTKP